MIKNKKPIENHKRRQNKSTGTWIILDSVIFLILILVISSAMILISLEQKDEIEYYAEYIETDEYIEDSMQAVLDSTVPRVEYDSQSDSESIFVDLTIKQLIIEDLTIRLETTQANYTSLQQGIENKIENMLDSIFFDNANQDYVFICSDAADTNYDLSSGSKIVISDLDSPSQIIDNSTPAYEKSILPNGVKNGSSEIDEIIIQLFLL